MDALDVEIALNEVLCILRDLRDELAEHIEEHARRASYVPMPWEIRGKRP